MLENYNIKKLDLQILPNEKLVDEMKHWGKIMGNLRMVPYVTGKGWAGNIGFRDCENIWVTCSGGMIDEIKVEDVIGISKFNNEICFWGDMNKKPTSEWEIYWGIFRKRKDVNAILHGHDLFSLEVAEKLGELYSEKVALTRHVTESGSPEFRKDILEILTDTNSYLIGRQHGFFALGKTFEEAGLLALEFRSKANELMVGENEYNCLLKKYHIG
jgi:L-fuculose-phosphate aldolase